MAAPIRMNFQKISKGGGVIFNPKIHVADFGNFSYYLALVPPCTYSIISIIKKLSRAVWNFSEKSSDLVQPSFPYWTTGKKTNILFHERMMLVNHQYSRALHFARFLGLPHLTIFCAQNIAKGQGEIERVFLWAYLLSISKWFQSRGTDLV